MSLFTLLQAYQTPLTFLLVILGPALVPRILSLYRQRWYPNPPPLAGRDQSHQQHPRRPRLSIPLKTFLILHTLYQASHLLFPPYDLFVSHRLSILSPNQILRSTLLNQYQHQHTSNPQSIIPTSSNDSNNHPLLELLLTKLANLDNRYHYARYGHQPLLECLWCSSSTDYLLYSLPRMLAPYIAALVVIGLLGSNLPWFGGGGGTERGQRWGGLCGWVLGMACVGEIGVKYLWDVRAVDGDCLHLAPTINHLRPILLLLLPLLQTFLSSNSTISSAPTPSQLIPILANTQNTLRLASLLRESTQQEPILRAKWVRAGEVEGEARARIRADGAVRVAFEGVGESAIRSDARSWVEEGWRGLVRVQDGRGQ